MAAKELGWQLLVSDTKCAAFWSVLDVMPGKVPKQTFATDEVTAIVACDGVNGAWHRLVKVPVDCATSMMMGRSTFVPSVLASSGPTSGMLLVFTRR
ncbi:hypothetical protein G6F64_015296 [Rhizopus arrhizus]|uniref:Uncharacterized protein n=2 Tax=Rhizopus TaxID=4842 RepID=A0A9P7C167_9FUNG|nr:hypothetical protein G6F68_016471 [Rhizopus microsporus]KAG1273684.1 hypothetical protein G6F64_015296 [Rhizopus arrhizus]KAG1530698.1 hypothetical protein G6F50_017141 [Rhizopus delemar]